MTSPDPVAPELTIALQALQHRGQDSAGLATMSADGRHYAFERGLGTVSAAVSAEALAKLTGNIGVGHVRYPTVGRGVLADAQPFFYRQPGVLMAHNGNVTNYDELRDSLAERSIHLMSRCDIEPALCEFADALMRRRPAHHTIEDAVDALKEVQARVRGAYTLVGALMLDDQPTLFVFRDPNGIRPGIVGRRGNAWIVASESVALDALGFEPTGEPAPGEALFLRAGAEPIRRTLARGDDAPCVFEFIYFARPDSIMNGRSVYEVRLALGQELARRIADKQIVADVVVPVPDTARPAATSIAETLGLPLREGFIKNRYSGRTFIMPDAVSRQAALRLKLNPLPSEIRGRRVLLVDDSIVRGTTLRRVLDLLRSAGVAEIHLAIHAPPVRHPCYYGIDMSTEEELFARRFSEDQDALEVEAAAELGADSITWLTVEGMNRAFGAPRCGACFDGAYPQPVKASDRLAIASDRRTKERAI